MNAETPTDAQLMDAIRDLWEAADPPPPDLADGVLAALAAADLELEYELMTLVETNGLRAGVRGTQRHHHRRAVDAGVLQRHLSPARPRQHRRRRYAASTAGWSRPCRCRWRSRRPAPAATWSPRRPEVDGNGRFEFAAPGTGQARLSFTPDVTGDADAPRRSPLRRS